MLQIAFVVEAVIVSVGHDEVVYETDVHGLCGTLNDLCQPEVVVAGTYVARRMVVHQGNLRGPLEEGFAKDGSYVGCGLVDAAATDADFVYHLTCLVEQQDPEFFGGQVAQQGVEELVDVGGGPDGRSFARCLEVAAFAQFEGSHDGDAFGRSHAFEAGEVAHFPLGQPIQVVATGREDALHQGHGTLVRIARANQDAQQLGVGQSLGSLLHHLFARAVGFGQLFDGEFVHGDSG